MNPYSVFTYSCNQQWPGMEKEHRFAAPRKWRFDLAWPNVKIACEIEGGIWIAGRHARGKGYEADCEKYSTAASLGWCVIRVTPGMIKSGKAMDLLDLAFKERTTSTNPDLAFLRRQAD